MIPLLFPADYSLAALIASDGYRLISSDGYRLTADNTAAMPEGNGLGALTDAIVCEADSEINGGYELTMQYPITGRLMPWITPGNLILAKPCHGVAPQLYRIYRKTTPESGVVDVYARLLAQADLAGYPVRPFSGNNAADAVEALENAQLVDSGYAFFTDLPTPIDDPIIVDRPGNVLSALSQIAEKYGGEVSVFQDTTQKTVGVKTRIRYSNDDVRIQYGGTLINAQQEQNIADAYTGIVAYWQSGDICVMSRVHGNIRDTGYPHARILLVDASSDFLTIPSADDLLGYAADYAIANNIQAPAVSLTLSYADVRDPLSLGGLVKVYFPSIGAENRARCMKIRYDVLRERNVEVAVGSVRRSITDTLYAAQGAIGGKTTPVAAATIAARISQIISDASAAGTKAWVREQLEGG